MNSPYTGNFKVSQIQSSTHDGLDLVGIDSKTIRSTVIGKVEYAGWENPTNQQQGFGQYVKIIKDDTTDRYYYGHMSKIHVKTGDRVSVGNSIGEEGNTGHSFGSHCHYCARTNGDRSKPINISEISGIPNSAGIYNDKSKEDEAMWVKDSVGWWYKHSNGSFTKEGWDKIDSCWYYFNAKGYAVTGYQTIENKLYYFVQSSVNGLKECQLLITNENGPIKLTV